VGADIANDSAHTLSSLFLELDGELLDDRIRKYIVGELVSFGFRLGRVRPVREFNLEELPLPHVLDAGITEVVQRGTDRTALGVEYSFLECNVDNSAHKSIVFLRMGAPSYVDEKPLLANHEPAVQQVRFVVGEILIVLSPSQHPTP